MSAALGILMDCMDAQCTVRRLHVGLPCVALNGLSAWRAGGAAPPQMEGQSMLPPIRPPSGSAPYSPAKQSNPNTPTSGRSPGSASSSHPTGTTRARGSPSSDGKGRAARPQAKVDRMRRVYSMQETYATGSRCGAGSRLETD